MWMTFNHLKSNFTKFAHNKLKIRKVIEFFDFESLMQHPLCEMVKRREVVLIKVTLVCYAFFHLTVNSKELISTIEIRLCPAFSFLPSYCQTLPFCIDGGHSDQKKFKTSFICCLSKEQHK